MFFIETVFCSYLQINPLVPKAPFPYPLKTSENFTVFLCFQGVEKGCIGNEWVNWCTIQIILLYVSRFYKLLGNEKFLACQNYRLVHSSIFRVHCIKAGQYTIAILECRWITRQENVKSSNLLKSSEAVFKMTTR